MFYFTDYSGHSTRLFWIYVETVLRVSVICRQCENVACEIRQDTFENSSFADSYDDFSRDMCKVCCAFEDEAFIIPLYLFS